MHTLVSRAGEMTKRGLFPLTKVTLVDLLTYSRPVQDTLEKYLDIDTFSKKISRYRHF